MKANLKKKILNIILIFIFLVGLGVMLYPSISNFVNNRVRSKEINEYQRIIDELTNEEYNKMIIEAQEYNVGLVGFDLDTNAEKLDKEKYNKMLSLDNSGIMGYVIIEKIGVKLPIFHGSDSGVLQKGVGHLEGSSLPVTGESTHTALLAHTGLASSKLFTDLTKLEIGDTFKINILNEKYTYTIDQILVVEPYQTESLDITKGQNYATLITCTPYGVNSHRLLVRGNL